MCAFIKQCTWCRVALPNRNQSPHAAVCGDVNTLRKGRVHHSKTTDENTHSLVCRIRSNSSSHTCNTLTLARPLTHIQIQPTEANGVQGAGAIWGLPHNQIIIPHRTGECSTYNLYTILPQHAERDKIANGNSSSDLATTKEHDAQPPTVVECWLETESTTLCLVVRCRAVSMRLWLGWCARRTAPESSCAVLCAGVTHKTRPSARQRHAPHTCTRSYILRSHWAMPHRTYPHHIQCTHQANASRTLPPSAKPREREKEIKQQ